MATRTILERLDKLSEAERKLAIPSNVDKERAQNPPLLMLTRMLHRYDVVICRL